MATDNHGRYYWGVMVTKDVSTDGSIHLHADEIRVNADGSLVCIGNGGYPVLVLASGKWLLVHAASCLDGHPVACEHWGVPATGKRMGWQGDKGEECLLWGQTLIKPGGEAMPADGQPR